MYRRTILPRLRIQKTYFGHCGPCRHGPSCHARMYSPTMHSCATNMPITTYYYWGGGRVGMALSLNKLSTWPLTRMQPPPIICTSATTHATTRMYTCKLPTNYHERGQAQSLRHQVTTCTRYVHTAHTGHRGCHPNGVLKGQAKPNTALIAPAYNL